MGLACHGVICVCVRDCLVLSWACCVHKGSRSYVHLCPRFCSGTYRSARLAHRGPHCGEVRVLTPPLTLLPPPVCHPGCLHSLAHAAGHSHIMVASTSKSFCLPLLIAQAWINKLSTVYPLNTVVFDSARVSRPACFTPRGAASGEDTHGF